MANEYIDNDELDDDGNIVEFHQDIDIEVELECAHGKPVDVFLFDTILLQKRQVFLDRREQYGAHTENHRRFPQECRSGLYVKAARLIRDIEGGAVKKDTLIDLSNYCDIELANMEAE